MGRIDEFLEIPKEVLYKIPKITVIGTEEMYIENYIGILEYEDFFVRINTNIGNININGFNLKLVEMSNAGLKLTGKLENIDFEKRGLYAF